MIDFTSIEQMLQDTRQSGMPLWQNIQLSDCQRQDISPEASWAKMSSMLEAMIQADEGYRAEDRSHSGLVGGDGGKMAAYGQGETLCGPLLTDVIGAAMGPGVALVDVGAEAARACRDLLTERDELADRPAGSIRCYTSDRAVDFQRLASLFLGEDAPGQVEQIDITKY